MLLFVSHSVMSDSFSTPWTVARQGSSDWSGLPFPFPGDLADPGIEPASLALAGDSLPLSHLGSLRGCVVDAYSVIIV